MDHLNHLKNKFWQWMMDQILILITSNRFNCQSHQWKLCPFLILTTSNLQPLMPEEFPEEELMGWVNGQDNGILENDLDPQQLQQ
jgi:hypothetical protein